MMYHVPSPNMLPMQAPPSGKPEVDEVPLFIEPIVSWRSWMVEFKGDDVTLRSITYKTPWLKRKACRAHCLYQWTNKNIPQAHHLGPHNCPNLVHGCGFYSVKEIEAAKRWAQNGSYTFRVIGKVKIWGSVFRYTDGYISEYAYPSDIFVSENYNHWKNSHAKPDAEPTEVAELIEAAYGVDTYVGWPG